MEPVAKRAALIQAHTAVNAGDPLPVGLPRSAAPVCDESGRPGVRGPAYELIGALFVVLWLVYAVGTFVYSVTAYVRGEVGPWPPNCLATQ